MKKVLSVLLLFITAVTHAQPVSRPKLVVGIVVDQMRPDYLYRYYSRFGTGGFKRLMAEGFVCENTFIPYTPTYTAPGHTCVYTGSVPSLHGIIGNNWYDKVKKRVVYCTDDDSVQTIGSASAAGRMSPKNLWSNTITDELRLATNFRNKTIAIALKDRGSILPGGHTANASYWYDISTGGWISSSFYMKTLPPWVQKFNDRKLPDSFLKQTWKPLYNLETYTQSTADLKPYEDAIPREGTTFVHRTDTLTTGRYESFEYTPYGNTFTFDMAKAAIQNEALGKGAFTDFLAVSLSSTDYIGHVFGPNSVEIEDTYLRLDKDIASFLTYLDATVGKGSYLFFLTADHGVAHIAGFEKEEKLPAGALDDAVVRTTLNAAIQKQYNINGAISSVINYQVYLDKSVLQKAQLDVYAVKQFIIEQLIQHPAISKAFDLANLEAVALPAGLKAAVVAGYNQKLSGDVQFVYKPQWYDRWDRGTTHGALYPYDAHIPLLWYGWKVKPGTTAREVYMTDIAQTLAAMLHIQMPNASVGKVITEIQIK